MKMARGEGAAVGGGALEVECEPRLDLMEGHGSNQKRPEAVRSNQKLVAPLRSNASHGLTRWKGMEGRWQAMEGHGGAWKAVGRSWKGGGRSVEGGEVEGESLTGTKLAMTTK